MRSSSPFDLLAGPKGLRVTTTWTMDTGFAIDCTRVTDNPELTARMGWRLPATRARSPVLVHYVVGEIFLWHMSHKPFLDRERSR
jgi:hypothetical protein